MQKMALIILASVSMIIVSGCNQSNNTPNEENASSTGEVQKVDTKTGTQSGESTFASNPAQAFTGDIDAIYKKG